MGSVEEELNLEKLKTLAPEPDSPPVDEDSGYRTFGGCPDAAMQLRMREEKRRVISEQTSVICMLTMKRQNKEK